MCARAYPLGTTLTDEGVAERNEGPRSTLLSKLGVTVEGDQVDGTNAECVIRPAMAGGRNLATNSKEAQKEGNLGIGRREDGVEIEISTSESASSRRSEGATGMRSDASALNEKLERASIGGNKEMVCARQRHITEEEQREMREKMQKIREGVKDITGG